MLLSVIHGRYVAARQSIGELMEPSGSALRHQIHKQFRARFAAGVRCGLAGCVKDEERRLAYKPLDFGVPGR